MRRALLALLLALLSLSCGYRLAGTGSTLPSYIKKIYIPPFENKSTRAEIEQFLTSAVREEMVRRGKAVVDSKEDADAELMGTILSFNVNPISFNQQGEATRFIVTVTGKFILRDLHTGKVFYASTNYVFRDEYDVEEGAADFLTLQSETLENLAKDFAKSIVSTILEGF